jgi:hypothetical protein
VETVDGSARGARAVTDTVLYNPDRPLVFFPREWCATASQARYRGWKELRLVDSWDYPFDPRDFRSRSRFACRVTDSPFAEITHRIVEPDVPGAYPVWLVEA